MNWQDILRESLKKSREEYAAKLRTQPFKMLVFDREPTFTNEQLKATMEELKKVNLFDADGHIKVEAGATVLILTDGEGKDDE